MKTNSVAKWPTILPDAPMTAYNSKRKKIGVVKLMPPPTPPDEKTIRELNALAARHPFCNLHKVKKHDPL